MKWSTPKTDWFGGADGDGVYTGDRFNASDFNRIKNNLEYLRELSISMYEAFAINLIGPDRTPRDYFYADEINRMEENLTIINQNTIRMKHGTPLTYTDNGNTMDFTELNRLENAILDLYERLRNQFEGRRMFTWNFGMRGGGF